MSSVSSPASRSALRIGPSVFCTRCWVISQNVSVVSERSTNSPLDSLADQRRFAVVGQGLLRLARFHVEQPHVARVERRQVRFLERPAHQSLVEIVAAESGVAIGRKNLEDAARIASGSRCRTCRRRDRRRHRSPRRHSQAHRRSPRPSAH
jgi:hypothetical protein